MDRGTHCWTRLSITTESVESWIIGVLILDFPATGSVIMNKLLNLWISVYSSLKVGMLIVTTPKLLWELNNTDNVLHNKGTTSTQEILAKTMNHLFTCMSSLSYCRFLEAWAILYIFMSHQSFHELN